MSLKLFRPVPWISGDEESILTAGTLLHNLETRLFLSFYHLIFSADIYTQILIKSHFYLSFDKLNGLSSLSFGLKDIFFLSGIIFLFILLCFSTSLLKYDCDTDFYILISLSAILLFFSYLHSKRSHKTSVINLSCELRLFFCVLDHSQNFFFSQMVLFIPNIRFWLH